MTDRNLRRCAVVGIVITSILIGFTFSLGGLHIFQRNYQIKAIFDQASGVKPGDPVRVAGVPVGTVGSVERRPSDVALTLTIHRKVILSEGTSASIRLRTLLGTKYVSLADPGAGPVLQPKSIIPKDRTQSPVDLDTALNAINHSVAPIDTNAVNGVLQGFGGALSGHEDQVRTMIGDLNHLAGVLASRKADIDRLVSATDRLSGTLDSRRQEMASAIDSFATVLKTLADRRSELSNLITGVKGLSDRLTPLLDRNSGILDSTISDVITSAKVLDSQRSRMDLALQQLPVLAERFTRITGQGPFVQSYLVGIVPLPYFGEPIDLGSNQSNQPGRDGGLPRLWVDPGTKLNQNVAGSQISSSNDTPPPPAGYPGR